MCSCQASKWSCVNSYCKELEHEKRLKLEAAVASTRLALQDAAAARLGLQQQVGPARFTASSSLSWPLIPSRFAEIVPVCPCALVASSSLPWTLPHRAPIACTHFVIGCYLINIDCSKRFWMTWRAIYARPSMQAAVSEAMQLKMTALEKALNDRDHAGATDVGGTGAVFDLAMNDRMAALEAALEASKSPGAGVSTDEDGDDDGQAAAAAAGEAASAAAAQAMEHLQAKVRSLEEALGERDEAAAARVNALAEQVSALEVWTVASEQQQHSGGADSVNGYWSVVSPDGDAEDTAAAEAAAADAAAAASAAAAAAAAADTAAADALSVRLESLEQAMNERLSFEAQEMSARLTSEALNEREINVSDASAALDEREREMNASSRATSEVGVTLRTGTRPRSEHCIFRAMLT